MILRLWGGCGWRPEPADGRRLLDRRAKRRRGPVKWTDQRFVPASRQVRLAKSRRSPSCRNTICSRRMWVSVPDSVVLGAFLSSTRPLLHRYRAPRPFPCLRRRLCSKASSVMNPAASLAFPPCHVAYAACRTRVPITGQTCDHSHSQKAHLFSAIILVSFTRPRREEPTPPLDCGFFTRGARQWRYVRGV